MQAPILDFGSIKVGVRKSVELVLANPDQQEQVAPAFVHSYQSLLQLATVILAMA